MSSAAVVIGALKVKMTQIEQQTVQVLMKLLRHDMEW